MIDVFIKTAWYKKEKPVIKDLSLKMSPGETVTVQGASGAGKSTLLSIIAGLHKNFDGSVKLGGRVALMPQASSLLPFYTLLGNTTLLVRATGGRADKGRALSLLNRLGLSGLEKKYPGELSGGELRRAQLAQTLYLEPDILLMDEPFTALDNDTKSLVMDMFIDIQKKQDITTVFVTHDSFEAEKIGGRLIELSREGCGHE